MTRVTQTQMRCAACNRRLADVVNEVEAGQVIFGLKCPRCGQPNIEIIRPSPPGKAEILPECIPHPSETRGKLEGRDSKP